MLLPNDLSQFIESTLEIDMRSLGNLELRLDSGIPIFPARELYLMRTPDGEFTYTVGNSPAKLISASCTAIIGEEAELRGIGVQCKVEIVALRAHLLGALPLSGVYKLPSFLDVYDSNAFFETASELDRLQKDRCKCAVQSMTRRKRLEFTLLDILLQNSTMRSDANDAISKVQRLRPVIEHIDQNIHLPLSRSELAAIIKVSPSRLNSLFKECLDLSPMSYLRRRRLNESRKRLANCDAPIQVVADEFGFSDAFHFSKQFSKEFGQSPSLFRHRARDLFTETRLADLNTESCLESME